MDVGNVDVVDSKDAAVADTGGVEVVADERNVEVVVDRKNVEVVDGKNVDMNVAAVHSMDVEPVDVGVNAKSVAVIVHVEKNHDGLLLYVGPDVNQNEAVGGDMNLEVPVGKVGGKERIVCAHVAKLWDPGGPFANDDETQAK